MLIDYDASVWLLSLDNTPLRAPSELQATTLQATTLQYHQPPLQPPKPALQPPKDGIEPTPPLCLTAGKVMGLGRFRLSGFSEVPQPFESAASLLALLPLKRPNQATLQMDTKRASKKQRHDAWTSSAVPS